MTKPSKRQTNCPSWFFIHFQWGFRKQYSPPPRLFFNPLNCSLVFLNAVSSLSSNSKSTHMHTHEHTALLKSTVRSPTYEPKLQTLKRCERGSHAQSHKPVQASGVRRHLRASSTRACVFVCFAALYCVENSAAVLCQGPSVVSDSL